MRGGCQGSPRSGAPLESRRSRCLARGSVERGTSESLARQRRAWRLPGVAAQRRTPGKHAAKPHPCCRRPKRRRFAGAVFASKPRRRLRPPHPASCHHAPLFPAHTETALQTPSPHDSAQFLNPLSHNAQHTIHLPRHTTLVRTGIAHLPICSRTRWFEMHAGARRVRGSNVMGPRWSSVCSPTSGTRVCGCGRHWRASWLEIMERTPRELPRAFNFHGQIR